MSIEFWTSLCEVEMERDKKGIPHKNLISRCASSVIDIMKMGLERISTETEEDKLLESRQEQEYTVPIASGICIENLALIVKDDIVNSIGEWAYPRLSNSDWTKRYTGLIALGAILGGPSQTIIRQCFGTGLLSIFNLINDQSLKVRQAAAWFYLRLAEFQYESIFQDE